MENKSIKNKRSATSDNFFKGYNEINNGDHIKNYYTVQNTNSGQSVNYSNNPTNPNQSPKIQSGKLRESQANMSNINIINISWRIFSERL